MTNEAQAMAEKVRDRAAWWCMRAADRDMTLEEQAELEAWLAAAPAHRETFARAAAIWQGAARAADAPELIAVRADALESLRAANRGRWARIRGESGIGRLARSASFFVSRRRPGPEAESGLGPGLRRDTAGFEWWRAAFALAACFALVLIGSFFLLRDTAQLYETGIGERRIVRLEDGSRLSLDAATRIEVAYGGERRTLRLLSGRAKFDVAHDPLRPFSVAAGDRLVVATGTSFSVELVRGQMRVILYEGNVAVFQQPPDGGPPRRLRGPSGQAEADRALRPGRELVAALDRSLAAVVVVEPTRSLAWENGVLSFNDEPLARASERVNRYSALQVRAGDEAIAGLLVSGLFNAGDTEGFVDGVTALFPVEARREGDAIVLTAARRPRR